MSAAICSVSFKQGDNIISVGSDTWQGLLAQVSEIGGFELANAVNEKMRSGVEAFCSFDPRAAQTFTTGAAQAQTVTVTGQPQQQWQQRPQAAQPSAPPVPPRFCQHGEMPVKTGMGKNNKPYTRYSCPQGLCEVQWG